MSGEGSSSIKRYTGCAARLPVLSKKLKDRGGVTPEGGVYGLLSQQRRCFCIPLKGLSNFREAVSPAESRPNPYYPHLK